MNKLKFLLIFLLLFFLGCKSLKLTSYGKVSRRRLLKYYHSRYEINAYSARFLLKSADENTASYSFNGNIKITKDSLYFSLLLPFGITAVEALITADTIKLYIPLQKKYTAVPSDSLIFYFDPSYFIKILTADIFTIPPINSISKYKFIADTLLFLQYRKKNKVNPILSDYFHRLAFEKNLLLKFSNYYYYPNFSQFNIYYSHYKQITVKRHKLFLPDKIQFEYLDLKNNYRFDIILKKIKLNQTVKISFKIPNNAKKVDFSDITVF